MNRLRTSPTMIKRLPPHNGYGLQDTAPLPPQSFAYGQNPERIQQLLDHGVVYWLQTNLSLASPAATSTITTQTTAVDSDLLIIGAQSNLYLSTIQIQDLGKDNLLTNAAVAVSSIAGRQSLEPGIKYWLRPYLLSARTQFQFSTTGDGTETGGFLNLLCLKLPVGM